jgi:hypothetical protein
VVPVQRQAMVVGREGVVPMVVDWGGVEVMVVRVHAMLGVVDAGVMARCYALTTRRRNDERRKVRIDDDVVAVWRST